MAVSSPNRFALPSNLDLQRAILCCACSYRNKCSQEELAVYAHSVHLTTLLYGERSLYRMVLAIAADDDRRTLFVALPGSQTFRDWLVNLDIRHKHLRGLGMFQGSVEGLYHSGFVSRLQEILPDMPRLSDYMSKESIDRLVFCGHSLGGVLAHIALIRFVIHNGLDVRGCQHISIAFGSPNFCDSTAASYLDRQLGLGDRMFTYVKQDDPVPRLLNDFERTRSAAVRFLLKQGRKRMKLINWCPLKMVDTNNQQAELLRSSSPQGAQLPPAFSHQDFGLSWVALFSVLQFTAPRYAQVGRFFLLPEESPDQRLPQEPALIHEDLQAGAVGTINSETIQKHTTGAYLRVCHVRTSLSTTRFDVRPESICPHISSAKFIFRGKLHEELKEAHILIEGQNLFLPWRCRVQGLSRSSRRRRLMENSGWEIHSCDHVHSRIVLELRQKVSLAMISSFTKCKFQVTITTCFGESNECAVTVQQPSFDSLIQLKASRSIGRLLLLKACGFSEELHDCKSLLTDALRKAIGETEQTNNFLRALEYMPQELHEKLSRTREEFVDPLVTKLTTINLGISARAIVGCSVGNDAVGLPLSSKKVFTYDKQLAYLVQCCTTDHEIVERGPSRRQTTKASSVYEETLYMLLRDKPGLLESDEIRKRMTRDLPENLTRRLLRKAEVLCCIWKANELLEGKLKVVMFVGPEFAGKSELIGSLIKSAELNDQAGEAEGQMQARPKAGVQGSVQCCWMVAGEGGPGAVLVEVPGNVRRARDRFQRWPDLEHVPDLCVVVVSYAGDTKEAAKEWAAEARQLSACRNLLMVVNGVDRVLHGREGAPVWATATKEVLHSRRLLFAHAASLPPECVFMAVARPPDELEQPTVHNLKERKILLRPDITAELRSRIAGIHTTPDLDSTPSATTL